MDISELSSGERTLVGYLAVREPGPWNLLRRRSRTSDSEWVVIPNTAFAAEADGRLDTPRVRSQESVRLLESKNILVRDTYFDTLQLSALGKEIGQQIIAENRSKAA